jgi:NAD(P)H-dependent FMN reductase
MGRFRIVGINGSLRRVSINGAVIDAAVDLAPGDVVVEGYRGLADLPPFNPDIEDAAASEPVRSLRQTLAQADALVISSPEYAHGVPGVLKNALDWVVGSGELIDKPVAVFNASTRARHAWESLVETLTTMSAVVVREASITLPLDGRRPDAAALAADAAVADAIRTALASLAAAVASRR